MPDISAEELARVNSFPKLVALLRDRLEWPINEDYEFEDVIFEYEPHELGLKEEETARVREIHQLRPLVTNQPWGVFFISFEEKQLSVTVLRRILRALVVKQRGAATDRQAWDKGDLIFAANFGKSGERELAFVHFSDGADNGDLPVMKVLGWNAKDTKLHNDYAAGMLTSRLAWPDDESDDSAWRRQWSSAFEIAHRQVIKTSRELAIHLAGLATQIRARANELLAAEADDGPMQTMLEAFRKNLIHDLDEDGFADMFAQTICYGMLAAAISHESGALVADKMADMVPRTNPFLKELFVNFLKLGGRDKRSDLDFDELGVREVVDMLRSADMPAVLRDFGDRNPKEDPVIHFYELFLKEYDPAKRMQRGVFYTPRPVVNFIVRGVDEILRTEFDLPLGLADTTTWGELAERNDKITIPDHIDPDQPFVQILDPATGTGTFLVEVIDLIHKRMVELWQGEGKSKAEISEAWNEYVPAHLLPRLTAFELMMAPYSIAHMKVGLKLSETGYNFSSDERARIILTNALEPATAIEPQFEVIAGALSHEVRIANAAKQSDQYTVFIGNPPYAQYSSNLQDFAKKHIEPFRFANGERIRRRNQLQFERNINDDFVKFFGLSKTLRANITGLITNRSYLESDSLVGLRENFQNAMTDITVVDLRGSAEEAGRVDRLAGDQNVFDIMQGVAIFLGRTSPDRPNSCGEGLNYIELIGSRDSKFESLLDSFPSALAGTRLMPGPEDWLYIVRQADDELPTASIAEILPSYSNLVASNRDRIVVGFDSDQVSRRVTAVRDFIGSNEEWSEEFGITLKANWNADRARAELAEIQNLSSKIVPIEYKPFDIRKIFFDKTLVWQPAPVVSDNMLDTSNVLLISLGKNRDERTNGFWVSEYLADKSVISSRDNASGFPLWFRPSMGEKFPRPNINARQVAPFSRAMKLMYNDGIPRGEQESMGADYRHQKAEQTNLLDQPWDGRGDLEKDFGPRDLFDWIYAILHAPSYRSRYAEFLKSDFPRIPIPKDRATFAALVPLGRRLVALHLLKTEDEAILKNPDIRFAGSSEARVAKGYPKYKNGKVEINAGRWFEDVPRETWEFHVGGYQVCEKWLKDRAEKGDPKKDNHRPGRVLSEDDILHYRRVVTALTETRAIMAQIDDAIEEHGGWPGAFSVGAGEISE